MVYNNIEIKDNTLIDYNNLDIFWKIENRKYKKF